MKAGTVPAAGSSRSGSSPNANFCTIHLVFFGFAIGWVSATIARHVYRAEEIPAGCRQSIPTLTIRRAAARASPSGCYRHVANMFRGSSECVTKAPHMTGTRCLMQKFALCEDPLRLLPVACTDCSRRPQRPALGAGFA